MRVIAHRALAPGVPENSIEAIEAAADAGADAVELDVRLTRDGTAVLLHDGSPWRTARNPIPVRWLRHPRFTSLRHRGGSGTLPTLEEGLRALPPGVDAALDVKAGSALVEALDVIERLGVHEQVLLWVRSAEGVARALRHVPASQVALLHPATTETASFGYLREALDAGAGQVSIHQRAVSERLVREAHDAGLVAWCWVLDEAEHERVIATGVDGVVTDWPATARALAPPS